MNKYEVNVQTLYWFNEVYLVEAESEEDIDEDLILSSDGIQSSVLDSSLGEINSIDKITLVEENI